MLLYRIFFFNDTAATEICTLSLHDALPIFVDVEQRLGVLDDVPGVVGTPGALGAVGHLDPARDPPVLVLVKDVDRKSTRLNSSHANISYAVFCLKKKNRCLLSSLFLSLHLT